MLANAVAERDPQRAIAEVNLAVDIDSSDALLLLDAAWILLALDPRRGRELGAQADSLHPDDAEAQALLAYLKGRYSLFDQDDGSAESYLREAVALSPESQVFAEAYVELLVARGKTAEARAVSDASMRAVLTRDLLDAQRERLGW